MCMISTDTSKIFYIIYHTSYPTVATGVDVVVAIMLTTVGFAEGIGGCQT